MQNEFIKLRFNQLPKNDIINFLSKINRTENLQLTDNQLESIYSTYKSDMRGMINYMQSNQLAILNTNVIDKSIFKSIDNMLMKKDNKKFKNFIILLLNQYNIDLDTIIKQYCSYIIRENITTIDYKIIKNIEYIIHNRDTNQECKINLLFYSSNRLSS